MVDGLGQTAGGIDYLGWVARTTRPVFADVAGACVRQWTRIAGSIEDLPDEAFAIVTRVAGWRLSELAIHCVNCVNELALGLDETPARARWLDIQTYSAAMRCESDERDLAVGELDSALLKTKVHTAVGCFAKRLEAANPDQSVVTPAGVISVVDFLVTRCIEGVVHGLDLAAATPRVDPEPDPAALKIATRALLDLLSAKAPGRSVEMRVPPIAAVQIVEGPRHTRGTPGSLVETDPITWVELATGRLSWSDAADDGRVRASGERSDLRALLPLP